MWLISKVRVFSSETYMYKALANLWPCSNKRECVGLVAIQIEPLENMWELAYFSNDIKYTLDQLNYVHVLDELFVIHYHKIVPRKETQRVSCTT